MPDASTSPISLNDMATAAGEAASLLRSLSNPSRLMILCALAEGPRRVGELEEQLDLGQAYVSQQLARLREDGLVSAQREGRSVTYSLAEPRVTTVIEALHSAFCSPR